MYYLTQTICLEALKKHLFTFHQFKNIPLDKLPYIIKPHVIGAMKDHLLTLYKLLNLSEEELARITTPKYINVLRESKNQTHLTYTHTPYAEQRLKTIRFSHHLHTLSAKACQIKNKSEHMIVA